MSLPWGLPPKIITEIFDTIRRLNAEDGITILLVEQNAHLAFSIADYSYIMESGQIVMEGVLTNCRTIQTCAASIWGLGMRAVTEQVFAM